MKKQYADKETRYDFKNMPEMRENDYPSGKCPVLADILSGVQGEDSAGGNDHKNMPKMRPKFHLFFRRPSMAEILPDMPERVYRLTLLGGIMDGY